MNRQDVPVYFLYITGFLFACVVAYQILVEPNGMPNPLAIGIMNLVVGYVINSVGMQHGVNVTNDVVGKTATAQAQLLDKKEENLTHDS